MIRFTLATKLLAAFLVILSLLMAISAYMAISREADRLESDLINHSKTLSELGSGLLYDELIQNSPIPLQTRMANLVKQMDYAVNVTFYGVRGNQYYNHSDSIESTADLTDSAHKIIFDPESWFDAKSIAINPSTGNYFYVIVPIVTRGIPLTGESRYAFNGIIQVTFSKDYIRTMVKRVSNGIIVLSLILAAGGGFLAWLSSRYFNKRIERLSLASAEFKKGNYKYRITEFSADELGDLSHAFNDMAKAASESFEQLEEKNASLEKLTSRLVKSETRIRSLWENASDSILHLETDGTIRFANSRFLALTGSNPPVMPENLFTLVQESDRPIVSDFISSLMSHQDRAGSAITFQLINGAVVEMTATELSDETGTLVQAFIRDVTERKALQDQLVQSRKMETVGRLAGGVAHDFNNLLAIIIPNTELVRMRTADPKIQQYTDQVLSASKRAADVVRHLLDFSRQKAIDFHERSVHAVLETTVTMMKELITDTIRIETGFFAREDRISLDEHQFIQMMINLAIFARDSMPAGGTVRIETRNAGVHRNNALTEMVMVKVLDNGSGIPKELLPKIFEPFFNTKKVGEGTGLGLAGVYSIVLQHNGIIEVESEEGKGTAFTLMFPAVTV